MARIAWYGLLAIAALVTAGLQLDKQAESTPAVVPFVPEPFRSFAQARIAEEAYREEDMARALAEARKLIARRPVPAEHMSLLAMAQVRAGKIEEGSRSMQLAAQRGWRDVLAQDAMVRIALDLEDKPEAARRYTALLVQDRTPDEWLLELGPRVFGQAQDEARATLVEIIAGSARWGNAFLRRGARVMPPRVFRDVVARSIEQGVGFDCSALAGAVRVLSRRDEAAAAALAAKAPPGCRIDRTPG